MILNPFINPDRFHSSLKLNESVFKPLCFTEYSIWWCYVNQDIKVYDKYTDFFNLSELIS